MKHGVYFWGGNPHYSSRPVSRPAIPAPHSSLSSIFISIPLPLIRPSRPDISVNQNDRQLKRTEIEPYEKTYGNLDYNTPHASVRREDVRTLNQCSFQGTTPI